VIDPRTGAVVYARCAILPQDVLEGRKNRPKIRALKCVWDGTITLCRLHRRLDRLLTRAQAELDYFAPGWGSSYDQLTGKETWQEVWRLHGGYRWLACYAVTGDSEGHYIHVELIGNTAPEKRLRLWLGKTFAGMAHACQVATLLAHWLGA
jgi:hypothetical protein